MTPTRAELEQRVEEAYAAVLQAAQDYRDAAAHWGNSLRKEHHGRVLDYGAACQALGEHIGREALRPALPADVPRPDVEGIRANLAAGDAHNCHTYYDGCRCFEVDAEALAEYILDLEAEIRRHHADFERWEAMAAKAGLMSLKEARELLGKAEHEGGAG